MYSYHFKEVDKFVLQNHPTHQISCIYVNVCEIRNAVQKYLYVLLIYIYEMNVIRGRKLK